jgi:hypothetical protein
VGEENNFDLYNVGRVPYLRADLAQKTYALDISKTKNLSHCIYRIRLDAIFMCSVNKKLKFMHANKQTEHNRKL